jgi:hypothetical protein
MVDALGALGHCFCDGADMFINYGVPDSRGQLKCDGTRAET